IKAISVVGDYPRILAQRPNEGLYVLLKPLPEPVLLVPCNRDRQTELANAVPAAGHFVGQPERFHIQIDFVGGHWLDFPLPVRLTSLAAALLCFPVLLLRPGFLAWPGFLGFLRFLPLLRLLRFFRLAGGGPGGLFLGRDFGGGWLAAGDDLCPGQPPEGGVEQGE